ncbi:MAG: TonB-dependent receptor, partial [Methylovirgula sp.]
MLRLSAGVSCFALLRGDVSRRCEVIVVSLFSRPSACFCARLFCLSFACLSPAGSRLYAQEASPGAVTLQPVVISATRLPTPVSEVGSSVTIITSADMEAKQERTLPDALVDVPGLNVVQTGGPGGTTSVFI